MNTIVLCVSSVYHGVVGCIESRGSSKACVTCDRLSRKLVLWFFAFVVHRGEVLVYCLYGRCSEEVEGGGR